ncbi:MAG: type II toxin-antitoxin system RelE/ParE family toxin [Flavobacteriales bacterium]|nr:type II toxin-antitoxin system RelE/ParE family toxin [Flavobacteriales bacterium]
MSVLPIRYTSEADNDYINVITRILNKWGRRSALNLDDRIKMVEQQIAKYPEMYPRTEQKASARKCVVTKQTTLFYTILTNEIVVVAIFDNRQDPAIFEKRG